MKNAEKILSLKPTQFAVGMLEVDEKIKIVRSFSKKELKKFIREEPVPVVKAPNGDLYIVNRHHFLCVCYHLGVKKVRIEITNDHSKSKMTYRQFWNWMETNRSFYPYCQFGEGPRKEFYLPRDIRGLADDPYRSLAWFVRKAGAFENSEKNFAEFQWANFFRSHGLLDKEGRAGFESALSRAVDLAQSPKARKLPGFGKLNLEKKVKVKAEAKRRAHRVATQRNS
jgi:hypothetical protein